MRTQQDSRQRVVALDNLRAMCEHASSTCHRYWVESVSRSRVTVGYSNPDEYGSDMPIYAVYPCYPSVWPDDGRDNPRVVLDPIRVHGGRDNMDEGYQSIQGAIEDCATVWRTNSERNDWATHAEMVKAGRGVKNLTPSGKCASCTICDIKE